MFNLISNQYILITLALFVTAFLVLLFKYFDLKAKRDRHEREALRRSEKIIDKAMQEATSIISRSQVLGEEVRSKIAESSNEISDQQKDIYKKVLDEVRNQLYQVVQKASEDIKQDASSEISAFANSVRAETIATEQEVKSKISEEYLKWERELDEYKRLKYQTASQEIEKIISEVTKRVLGEALSPENHKDLILKALEEAKKSGVLSK